MYSFLSQSPILASRNAITAPATAQISLSISPSHRLAGLSAKALTVTVSSSSFSSMLFSLALRVAPLCSSAPMRSNICRWVTVLPNTAPTTPAAVTIPETIYGGKSVAVSWTASTDEQGNLEGYAVERSTDGGSTWTQIYQGGELSTTNTVAFGTESVMYRVRAYDSEGLYSGYRNSAQVTVINNTAPTAPGAITVPETVFGGGSVEISWTASMDGENNLAGYALERQADGGTWTEIFRGDALSFTDVITKGWLSVAYRVRAYDSENAYSGYTAGDSWTVDNNTPPAIACALPSGSDLGVKDEGFEIAYSVSDEEGDAVTVTESICFLGTPFILAHRTADSFQFLIRERGITASGVYGGQGR